MARPVSRTTQVDMLLGFTGFFGAIFLVVTVICEVTGRPALGWALTLLGVVVLFVLLLRRRARILRTVPTENCRAGV